MRKIKKIFLVLAIFAVLISSGALAAKDNCSLTPNRMNYNELYKDLNLTKDQKESLEKIQNKHDAETQELRREYCSLKKEIKKLWANENPNTAQIREKMNRLTDIKISLAEKQIALSKELKNILTKGQQEKLKQKKQRFLDEKHKER